MSVLKLVLKIKKIEKKYEAIDDKQTIIKNKLNKQYQNAYDKLCKIVGEDEAIKLV